jgi:hypothetical protein
MEQKQQKQSDPPPLGGHALPLGLLFPRWLGVCLVLAFMAITGITLYYFIKIVAGLF